ncbi:VCBS repeat-containing protein [Acidobacteria bacterium AB60]|nr:VCBS repeat-containing protein [Acidobacteria bacterium AB60]
MSYRSSSLAAVFCTMALAATCVAQSYTSFNIVQSNDPYTATAGWTPVNVYAVDVNNDGIPDIIQDQGQTSAGSVTGTFGVSIANGDGTFKPAVAYNYPPGVLQSPMTFGDFNGDGKIDIAMSAGNRTIAAYLGRGDGTFVNPWYSVIPMASGQSISGFAPLVAADFNHDGKLDLAVVGGNTPSTSGTTTVYIVPGEGNGLFSQSIGVLSAPTGINSTSSAVQTMFAGDYDSDGNADLAIAVTTGNNQGETASTTVHVLYGAGNFAFEDTAPINFAGPLLLNSGDLNSDGYTDLFALDSNSYRLDTYYGQAGRTFADYTQQLPQVFFEGFGLSVPHVLMADFNGDNRMDLATLATDYSGTMYMLFFLATGSPGQFDLQTWNVPNPMRNPSATGDLMMPVVGDFNHDGKPDWEIVNVFVPGSQSIFYTGLNTTVGQLWADCDYPTTGRGVHVCSPVATSGGAVNFNATAHSFGSLRKMELWVDGKKLAEQHHTWGGNAWFSLSSTLSPGTHQGAIFAADIDDTLQLNQFSFTVPSSCAAPGSAGVHICAPVNGSSTSSPVTVMASSTVSGTLARMEIWVDSTKKYTETNSTSLSAAVVIPAGTHTVTVFAVNTSGTVWRAASSVTVP